MTVTINEETLQDIINIETGLLAPLTGVMGEEDFRGVVDRCRLADGRVFPLPITLDVPPEQFEAIHLGDTLTLTYGGAPVAELRAESKFHMTDGDIEAVFRTLEDAHPGVRKERERWACRVGGPAPYGSLAAGGRAEAGGNQAGVCGKGLENSGGLSNPQSHPQGPRAHPAHRPGGVRRAVHQSHRGLEKDRGLHPGGGDGGLPAYD